MAEKRQLTVHISNESVVKIDGFDGVYLCLYQRMVERGHLTQELLDELYEKEPIVTGKCELVMFIQGNEIVKYRAPFEADIVVKIDDENPEFWKQGDSVEI